MQRRILLIAVVFVAGFGIGYGITWLFVGSPERGEAGGEQRAARDRTEGQGVGQAVPGGADAAVAPQPDVAPVAGAVDVVAANAPGSATAPDVPPVAPGPDAVLAAADAAAPSPEVVAEVVAEVAPAPSAPREIDVCLNKVCRIDFGGVAGGISVRKGKLEHGAEVVWERDFGRSDKVGTLDADRTVKVEVLGIGLTDGVPSAAYISRKLKRGTQTGVIALKIGDRRLSLVPLED